MSLFDGMAISEGAMSVHRYRSEVAARNLANVYTPGYRREVVDLQATNFHAALSGAANGTGYSAPTAAGQNAVAGAVRIRGTHKDMGPPDDERQQALQGTVDMMESKSAFELNMRAAAMFKSMALASLEIGRGG